MNKMENFAWWYGYGIGLIVAFITIKLLYFETWELAFAGGVVVIVTTARALWYAYRG